MHRVIRSLVPLAAGAMLVVGAGCADDQPAVCDSLGDLQASVQSLRDIELQDTTAEELQESANEIVTDANAVQDEADEELGQEVETFEATVQAFVDDLETASAEGELTRDSLAELTTSLGSVATAFDTLKAAAPDCDLD